jgi:hypothetical protein
MSFCLMSYMLRFASSSKSIYIMRAVFLTVSLHSSSPFAFSDLTAPRKLFRYCSLNVSKYTQGWSHNFDLMLNHKSSVGKNIKLLQSLLAHKRYKIVFFFLRSLLIPFHYTPRENPYIS